MKLVTYRLQNGERTGILLENAIIDMERGRRETGNVGMKGDALPKDMVSFLRGGEASMDDARRVEAWGRGQAIDGTTIIDVKEVTLAAPVPRPTSMRDGYAFRQHVEAARRNRGVEMIPEFDEIPIFYFTNHQAVYGPGDVPVLPMHLDKLDFELEVAIVIGKQGRNIKAADADAYVAGYTVMNDWSARAMQMHEMKLNLGPAKGKDFATSIGPWLVTREELAPYRIETPVGEKYDLEMTCEINGTEVSRGNVKDMSWTFAQIIERASYGVTLYPGDVIGSGTCGTGCFLELNGSKVYDPAWWLKIDDVVDCSIAHLGSLVNKVVAEQV
jgi:fumarylacetoacetate (FAA) hydrolase